MKVYAVVKRCDNDNYPDYTIVDNRVFMKKEDAIKLRERTEQGVWGPILYGIYEFEVRE